MALTIFKFIGVAGIVWFLIWFTVSAPTPEKSKSISDDEKRFIIEQVGQVTSSPATVILNELSLHDKYRNFFRTFRKLHFFFAINTFIQMDDLLQSSVVSENLKLL